MYVSASQLDHFLDFITSEQIIQELPFGERTLKLSSEKKRTVPNVVRKVTTLKFAITTTATHATDVLV